MAARRDAASLQIKHCMVNENAPVHLQTLKLKMHSEAHGASTRNATSKTTDQSKVWLQSTQNSFYQEQYPSGTKCQRNFKTPAP